jgi:hypothetical protein
MREKKYQEAYGVVKKIAKYFPANPDRLAQIIHLAIRTAHYEDMQMYYEIFTNLEERAQALKNYIGAGMYIAGKHCLLNNDLENGLQYFENIAVSCGEFSKFLRAVITTLIENEMTDDAEKYLARFDPSMKEHEDYLVSEFLILSRKEQDQGFVVKVGLDLYNRNIRDYTSMQALLEAMIKQGHKEDKITKFRKEIEGLFPDKISDIPA